VDAPTAPATSPTRTSPEEEPRTRVEVVGADRLSRVGARPPLGRYLAALWDRRHFLWADARARAASGTRETMLGTVWLVLRPVLDGLAYFLLFGLLMSSSRGIPNFLGYLIVGVFLFSFTTQCVTAGAASVLNGRNLVRAFAFPRAALPIAVVLREALTMVPTLVAMTVLVLVLPPGENVTWRIVLIPGVLALQAVFCTGLALLLARVTAAFPDMRLIIGLSMRFWLYGSAVFFSFDKLVEHPTLVSVLEANPMFMVLDMARDCLLYGVSPAGSTWLALSAWAVGSLVVGFLVFWQAEESYGRA
jgi:teichoic acid transport system permease protein